MRSKSLIDPLPPYYDRYIAQAPDGDLPEVLATAGATEQATLAKYATTEDYRYAPGKWTVKELLQHVIDTERIMAWRALTIARGETRELTEYDEDAYAAEAPVAERPFADLLAEAAAVRTASIFLFGSFTPALCQRSTLVAGKRLSVAALGFVIVGHAAHHLRVLDERYRP